MNNYFSPETDDCTSHEFMIHHLWNSNDSLYQESANFIYEVQTVF